MRHIDSDLRLKRHIIQLFKKGCSALKLLKSNGQVLNQNFHINDIKLNTEPNFLEDTGTLFVYTQINWIFNVPFRTLSRNIIIWFQQNYTLKIDVEERVCGVS